MRTTPAYSLDALHELARRAKREQAEYDNRPEPSVADPDVFEQWMLAGDGRTLMEFVYPELAA